MALSMDALTTILEDHRADLAPYETIYKEHHANPELSTLEQETSTLIIEHLKKLSPDLDIRTNIGGHGYTTILKHGPGKTVLLRSDIYVLPVEEKTDFPYASSKTMKDRDGVDTHVMHRLSNTIFLPFSSLTHLPKYLTQTYPLSNTHVLTSPQRVATTSIPSANSLLSQHFSRHAPPGPEPSSFSSNQLKKSSSAPKPWPMTASTTQPATPAPSPTWSSVSASRPSRWDGDHEAGPVMSVVDILKITTYELRGHGNLPCTYIGPVVIASYLVVGLQVIVSREIAPHETAVVTVESLQAGQKENVISNEAVLKLNTSTFTTEVRDKVFSAARRILKAECLA